MKAKIYHNPRCSKSRATLELLKENGIEPEVIEYLKTPPNGDELSEILDMLGIEPRDLMRKQEEAYKNADLDDKGLTKETLIMAMVQRPKIIERPIVVIDDKAAVGRPPESVLDILPK